MTITEIATNYADILRTIIECQRAGDNARAYEFQDRVIDATGCELWELIEAEDIINEAKFGGANPFKVAATPVEHKTGAKPYGPAADNNIEGQIIAKQERDNADTYI